MAIYKLERGTHARVFFHITHACERQEWKGAKYPEEEEFKQNVGLVPPDFGHPTSCMALIKIYPASNEHNASTLLVFRTQRAENEEEKCWNRQKKLPQTRKHKKSPGI